MRSSCVARRRTTSLYRDAVRASQPAICALHRGVTTGLLDGFDPGANLTDFVPKDPDAAGCLIEVQEREWGGRHLGFLQREQRVE
jgi:hypothetical protein